MRFARLDRAQKIVGDTDADALRRIIDHARETEKLGFERFFVAEHHGVPGIPGSQPGMLALAAADATSTIRIGTAGIQVPNHPPLISAEQIGVLAALHPGRIDVGLGNSVGFTQPVRDALRQGDPTELKHAYEADVRELLDYLAGDAAVTARPELSDPVPVYILAGFRSIDLAARLGTGVIVGGPSLLDVSSGPRHQGLENYERNHAGAGGADGLKHAMISLDVAVADTEEAARDLILPQVVAEVLSRRTGTFDGLVHAADIDESDFTDRERRRVADMLSTTIYGTPDQVQDRLTEICRYTGADDIVITGGMSDLAGQARSEEMLAEMAE